MSTGTGDQSRQPDFGYGDRLGRVSGSGFPFFRSGASKVAYARFCKNIVLERGPVAQPDIVLIGDGP